MPTLRQDLIIRQGETFSKTFVAYDGSGAVINLTGYTARMAVKRDVRSDSDVYFSTGSDASGGTIVLGGSNGQITISMTPAQSDALVETDLLWANDEPFDPLVKFLYDLEIVSGAGVVTRLFEGEVFFYRSITGPN